MRDRQRPLFELQGNTDNEHANCNPTFKRSPSKIMRVLRHLQQGQSLNSLEAVKLMGDNCLHSTISSLVRKGYNIDSAWELAWCEIRQDDVRVKRYSLNPNTPLDL